MTTTTRFNFEIPTKLHKELKKMCIDKEITMSEFLLKYIEKSVKSHKSKT